MQIQAEIFRQQLAVKNIGEQFTVARPQRNRVMRDIRILAFGAKVPHEQAHRIAGFFNPSIGPAFAMLGGHQIAVSGGRVGV